jgi:hypothetical protein
MDYIISGLGLISVVLILILLRRKTQDGHEDIIRLKGEMRCCHDLYARISAGCARKS